MIDRRDFLKLSAGGLALVGTSRAFGASTGKTFSLGPAILPAGTLSEAELAALPGKKPLIRKTYRAPNYETPVAYFNEQFTPNDVFFVRYHLANIPEVDAAQWRLRIGGASVEKPIEYSLEQLRREFEPVEIAAVCMCSGNRRGLFTPHVPGVEWGYGAMGNAKGKGVRLKDILNKAGLKKDVLEIVLNAADGPILDKTPDFSKSLPVWKAMDENTIVAYEMNGAPLPHWNGFPARLVVPGWTATYWMKHLTNIDAVPQAYQGFWMKSAYRIPKGKFPLVDRFLTQETEVNTPITEMVVNSLMTNIENGQQVPVGRPLVVRGVAWDAGYGIATVHVSVDGGKSWQEANLGQDYGRFSWRQWQFPIAHPKRGKLTIMARASNRAGSTQVFDLIPNPAGYHHNVVQKVEVNVA